MAFTLALILTVLSFVTTAQAPQEGASGQVDSRFISVSGTTLGNRRDAALKAGRAADGASHFWLAYGFDVRPGVAVDLEIRSRGGGIMKYEGLSLDTNPKLETRNLAVCMLHERNTATPDRVEVYNLDRQRGYDGYPVYWLGHAPADESLPLLNDLVASQTNGWVAERSVAAIALHNDPRAADMLEGIVRSSTHEGARCAALQWLGVVTDRLPFLASVARDDKESSDIRKKAMMAIGTSSNNGAIPLLSSLYDTLSNSDFREEVVDAVGVHGGREVNDDGVDFLIRVVDSERDLGVRKKAIFWLGQKAGQKSMSALERKLESPEDAIQAQVVFAISQRSPDEAVPILIRLARTHKSPVVRRQSIFWLGQIDDERVVPFMKELLAK